MTIAHRLFAALAVTLVSCAAVAQTPQVILDNPSVRIALITLPPGVGTGRYQGIEAEVGIVVAGEASLESPLGRELLRPGTAYWLPGLTPHDLRNEGQGQTRVYEIYLKRCN